MIILGVDPGSRKTGFAVIEVKGRKMSYLDSGVLSFEKEKNFLSRLGLVYDSCLKLIETYSPQEIAFESLIYVKSVTSLAKLAQARGAMMAAFMKTHKGFVSEYSPNLIKSSVSGHGHANKESIEKTMKILFGKDLVFKTYDESDALAIATAHAMLRESIQPKAQSGGRKASSLRNAFKHLESK